VTEDEFAQVVRERLVDAHTAAQLGGYAFRQGFWRAVQKGLMPQPIVTFRNLALWDATQDRTMEGPE
jgi:hypothetical protein